MLTECPGCTSDKAGVQEPGRRRARLSLLAIAPAVFYALVPKCPMCLVAYLSAFGVTVGMASVALSVLRPLAVALAVFALGFGIWRLTNATRSDQAQRDGATCTGAAGPGVENGLRPRVRASSPHPGHGADR